MRHKPKIIIKFLFNNLTFITSPILCLVCFFLACGRSPGQDVKIIVTTPSASFQNNVQPVSVSIQFNGFGTVFLKKNLMVGENNILLPKGPVEILTGFFAQTSKNNQSNSFMYNKVQQEVNITKNTRTLEVHYPQLKPIQYRKFGLIFKEKTSKGLIPLSGMSITVEDPTSETTIQNPLTGENLGFITDENGRASADLPMLENTGIRLLVHQNQNHRIVIIPESTTSDNFEFYEIIFDKKTIVQSIPATGHYMNETKTISEISNKGKNPRFTDILNTSDFQNTLNAQIKNSSEKFDILAPFINGFAKIKTDNPYNRAGREIRIQCKPHNGVIYINCARNTSVAQLKKDLGLTQNQEEKIDLLLTDQDNYSVFNDVKSTRENPEVIVATIPVQ